MNQDVESTAPFLEAYHYASDHNKLNALTLSQPQLNVFLCKSCSSHGISVTSWLVKKLVKKTYMLVTTTNIKREHEFGKVQERE